MKYVIYELVGGWARVTLNRPEKRNALSAALLDELASVLWEADEDREVHAVLLRGAGPSFCSGYDLGRDRREDLRIREGASKFRGISSTDDDIWQIERNQRAMMTIFDMHKPVVAQVHGYCLGGGTVYGYLTDLTIASDDAYFQMPLPQGFGLPGAQTMIEPWVMMNWKKAFEYLYLAPTLSAAEAKKWGLVNEVVPKAQLDDRVEEVAATIAQMPLSTILAIKAGVKRAWEMMGMRVHLQNTADFITICSGATDVREYMAKRQGQRPRQFAARLADDARVALQADAGAAAKQPDGPT